MAPEAPRGPGLAAELSPLRRRRQGPAVAVTEDHSLSAPRLGSGGRKSQRKLPVGGPRPRLADNGRLSGPPEAERGLSGVSPWRTQSQQSKA